jgi:cell division transport system permease protein
VRAVLGATPVVEQVFYESPQEALGRFREQFRNSSISRSVTEDAMPESFRVRLRDASRFQEVSAAVRDLPGVELVQDQRALLRRVFSVLSGVQAGAVAVAAAQVLAAALLISNTVRVSAHSRRRETAVMRLVGASKPSVRAPFLVEGALMGMVGAALAGGVLLAVEKWLVLGQLVPAYRFTAFIGWDALWRVLPVLGVAGVVLTSGASWWSLRRHLRV